MMDLYAADKLVITESMKYHFSKLKENRGNLKVGSAFWKFWWFYAKYTSHKLPLSRIARLVERIVKIGTQSG
jgi:hypothetical protein